MEFEKAEYSSKSDFSKAAVVREQISLCNSIRSKEMKAGYFNYTEEGKKIYVPDSRKEWISAVKALLRLLTPEIRHKDSKKIRKRINSILKEEEELFKKYAYYPCKKVVDKKTQKIVWKKIENSQPYIPEMDEAILASHPEKPRTTQMVRIKGIWNDKVNLYWNGLVGIYDKLFAELNVLIDKKNYFKQKSSYGFDLLEDEEED
ncbi:MAG: hypothetical protein ACOC56_04865 [Atribacterota bacterium]